MAKSMLLVMLGFTLVSGQTLNGINKRDLNSNERAVARYEGIIQFAGGSKSGTAPKLLSMDVQALHDAAYRGGEVYADHVWLRFNPDGSYDFGRDERCDEGRKYLSDYNGTIMTAPGKDIHIQGVPQGQLTIYSGRYIYMEDDFNYPRDSASRPGSPAGPGSLKMSQFNVATSAASQTSVQSLSDFKLTASDAAAGDQFGVSIAIDGDRAIVGAQFDDDHGTSSGAAYVFMRNGTSWIQEAKLTASDAAAGDQLGNSVAISGDRVIVGAIGDDDPGGSGAAYIFTFDGVSWSQTAKLKAGDAELGDNFGVSVSIDGNAAVVGAERDDDTGSSSGSAYVFRFNGASWSQEAKLTAGDAAAEDEFGFSVSISGDRVVVGARSDDDAGDNSGSAYVFFFDGTSWSQEAKLTASDAAAGDGFGISVSIDGDRVVVGARSDDEACVPFDPNCNSGSAYIFKLNGTSWSEEAKLTASDAAAGDDFGISVSIDGDHVVVGARFDDDAGANSGSAYVFAFDGTSWSQEAKLTASDAAADDNFGISVSIAGDNVVVGAPFDDDAGASSGSVYMFVTNQPPVADAGPDQTVECASPNGTGVTLDGSNSNDPDGDQLTYTWTGPFSEGGGTVTGVNPTVTLLLGTHTITLTVNDGNGGTDTDEVVINVVDTTPPAITLNGANPMTLACLAPYEEPGATVNDACDPSPILDISGIVNADVPGAYTLTYTATDASGNSASATRTVNVECPLPHPFVLLAKTKVTVDGQLSSEGDIHSNYKIEFREGNPSTHTGNLTAVNDITIYKNNTIDGNVTAGGKLARGSNVTITGTATSHATVAPYPLPTFSFTAGVKDVTVPQYESRSLAPGSYDDVIVGYGGNLLLQHDGSSGKYFLDKLDLKSSAKLSIDVSQGPVEINLVRRFHFDKDVKVVITPAVEVSPRFVTFNIMGCESIHIHERSNVSGNINAPKTKVILFDEVFFKGAVAAEEIYVQEDVTCLHHDSGSSTALTKTPASAAGDAEESNESEGVTATVVTEYALEQNYPNPFWSGATSPALSGGNPGTEIRFQLPEAGHVVVRIFTLSGQAIRTLVNGRYEAGYHTVRWDGRDDHGSPLASGVYLYRLDVGGFSQVKKMSLLR